jgi:hypothetical protein
MKPTHLACAGNKGLKDFSPLKGMPLQLLHCQFTDVSDLSPLRGMPLTTLVMRGIPAKDLSPLKDSPLKSILCDVRGEATLSVLRSIKTLQQINGQPAARFWQTLEQKAKKP